MKKNIIIATVSIVAIGAVAFWTSQKNITAPVIDSTEEQSDSQIEEITSVGEDLQQSSNSAYDIAFNVNENIFRVKVLEDGFGQLTPVVNEGDLQVIEMEKPFTTSVMPREIFEALPISENMIFYIALQSNLDPHLWFYTERVDEGEDYNVRMYNVSTKEGKILFNRKKSPNKELAFKPFAVSNDNSVLYLEGFHFDSYLNNEEVWTLDLNTLEVKELKVHAYYTNTPAMSPDGKYLLYPAASEPNDVHVTANQLYMYDIENGKESRVMSDEKAYVGMKGWVKSN